MRVQSLVQEDPLEEEMATHSSILAWEMPWTEEPGGYSPWARKESDTTLQLNSNNVRQWKIDILMGNPEVVWPHSMCSKIKSISTYRASLVAQLVKNLPAVQKTWVGKIPWRRERLPTPVVWPGEFHGLYSPWACKESDTTEPLSLSPSSTYHLLSQTRRKRDSGSWQSWTCSFLHQVLFDYQNHMSSVTRQWQWMTKVNTTLNATNSEGQHHAKVRWVDAGGAHGAWGGSSFLQSMEQTPPWSAGVSPQGESDNISHSVVSNSLWPHGL